MTSFPSPMLAPDDGGALFPIMADIRYSDEIRELRAAGVQSVIIAVPWAVLAPHEEQAQRNHGQGLRRLAERGGLSAAEAVAVIEDRRCRTMTRAAANARLAELVEAARTLGGER